MTSIHFKNAEKSKFAVLKNIMKVKKMEYKKENFMHKQNVSVLLNKTYFGKDNALSIQLNETLGNAFLKFGKKDKDQWTWIASKCNGIELGEIIKVLNGKQDSASFYHKLAETSEKRIVINRKENMVFFRIDSNNISISKVLNGGEQEELRLLLEYIVVRLVLCNCGKTQHDIKMQDTTEVKG